MTLAATAAERVRRRMNPSWLHGPIPVSRLGMVFLRGMCAVAFAWGVFGLSLLLRRKLLLAVHEVVAAVISMVFGCVLTGGAIGVALARGDFLGHTPHAHLTPLSRYEAH